MKTWFSFNKWFKGWFEDFSENVPDKLHKILRPAATSRSNTRINNEISNVKAIKCVISYVNMLCAWSNKLTKKNILNSQGTISKTSV